LAGKLNELNNVASETEGAESFHHADKTVASKRQTREQGRALRRMQTQGRRHDVSCARLKYEADLKAERSHALQCLHHWLVVVKNPSNPEKCG
jgi:hypothetical protein